MSNLSLEEQRAFQSGKSGRASKAEIPAPDSTAISIQPAHFIPNRTYVSISWDHGREIRVYHLGPGNILQELVYSENNDRNSLYYGDLHNLKIVLNPASSSSIAAVRHQDDGICIFFQDPNNGFIRTVRQPGTTGEWRNDPAKVVRAVKGSSIAVIMDEKRPARYRVYYQDPELHLKECYSSGSQWILGDFDSGIQPRGTPITAEVVHGGDVDINVTWRDARGRFAGDSWSKSLGWDLPNANGGKAPLDGRD